MTHFVQVKKYNTNMINEQLITKRISNALSNKLASEYSITRSDYSGDTPPSEIINQAYKKASDLFDPESETSIVVFSLQFYMNNIDKAIDLYIEGLDDYLAISKLLQAYSKIYLFMHESTDSFESMLAKELSENQDFYKLFPISYYKELYHTAGLDAALEELSNDVNIRAFTYYNSAHKKYMDYLPGLEGLIKSLTPKEMGPEFFHQ